MPDDAKQEQKSAIDRVLDALKGKVPGWAILLVLLFGSGGIVYTAYDFYLKHRQVRTYDGGLTLPDVQVAASFFPRFYTALPSSFVVDARNTSQARSVPNLKMSIDTGSAKIAQCENRGSIRGGAFEKLGDGVYSLTLPRIGPSDEVSVYCVGEGVGALKVKIAAREDSGVDLGSNEFQFNREISAGPRDSDSGFEDFLWILLGLILAVIALCIISVLFGLTGKLYRRWKLYDYEDK